RGPILFAIYDFSRGVRTKLTLLAIGRNTYVTFRRRTAQLAGRRLRHFRVERPKLDARPVWRRAGDLHRRDVFRPEPQPATDLHLGRSVDKERCVRISLGRGQRSTTHDPATYRNRLGKPPHPVSSTSRLGGRL